uniref:NADH dehydrogenase subunit 3 n=1 Tax=Danhatchia australis TaxID=2917549 RepID=UPI0023D8A0C5|nr:NADH dehydrogenase subunit 3 [Danhatchia australis]UKU09014.1 NADH dehydrogenase subunit 3 [Danhatchia australis]
MFLLHEYDIFWAFLIISSVIPILAFVISGILAPIRQELKKFSSYESGIEPLGDAWVQFRIRYYIFALVFVVFDVETIFLYPWAMSFDVLGVSVFIEYFIFVLFFNCGFSLCMAKRSVGMVLAEYLDNQKKREGKDDIETVMNLVELSLLNQKISNSIISTTSNDLSNCSRLSSL